MLKKVNFKNGKCEVKSQEGVVSHLSSTKYKIPFKAFVYCCFRTEIS